MKSRDMFGRALNSGGQLVYDYVDTSQSYLSALLGHIQGAVTGTSLLDSKPADDHESLMGSLAGAYVLFGARANATRSYADGSKVAYSGYAPVGSPLGDLVYAAGQLLADPTIDPTLSLTRTLITKNTADIARVIGDTLYAKAQADKHPEAQIPATSTFWDEMIDLVVQIAQDKSTAGTGQTRLLEDVLTAFADPVSAKLSAVFAEPVREPRPHHVRPQQPERTRVNLTSKNKTDPPDTPVDRTKPDAGANRSELQRFAQLVHDTNGVTACNKDGAILHANLGGLAATVCNNTTGGDTGAICMQRRTARVPVSGRSRSARCFKIDNLATFYLDSIVGKASLYLRPQLARQTSTVGVLEQSSGIGFHSSTVDDERGHLLAARRHRRRHVQRPGQPRPARFLGSAEHHQDLPRRSPPG